MKYDIVNVKLSHPSFSWGNGLYAVIERTKTELKMCQIDEFGHLSLFEDGKFMITCTGVNNPEVYPMGLTLEHEEETNDISKRIVYIATNSGIDGLGPRAIVYADFDEENLKRLVRTDKNKNWLTLSEKIVNVEVETRKSLAKLNALDKLLIGI